MPEMPEVQGLVEFLRGRVTGLEMTRVTVANIAALKTYDPPVDALTGARIDAIARHGKFVDLATTGGASPAHLVFHLARAGWLRWYDELPATVLRPGKSPIALRVRLDDGSGFVLTEAGTKKSPLMSPTDRILRSPESTIRPPTIRDRRGVRHGGRRDRSPASARP